MTPSPIALTPEQQQQVYNKKAERFMEGMQKLTEETGLVIAPRLQETEYGNMIILTLVDKPAQQPLDKSSV